jgi:hypothetical protein
MRSFDISSNSIAIIASSVTMLRTVVAFHHANYGF